MRQLFDEPWEDLSVDSLRRFLAGTREEGLYWEAKGPSEKRGHEGEKPHTDSVLKAVCGLANSSGGYLIVGAAQKKKDGPWCLPGAIFGDEPTAWTSRVINAPGGLAPVPRHEVVSFEIDEEDTSGFDSKRYAVVVRVEPVAVPPCITRSGAVFMRASSITNPVTDQRVLLDLIGRGENARKTAEDAALRAAQRLRASTGVIPSEVTILAVGFCAVEGPEDRAAAPFDQDLADGLFRIVSADMQADDTVSDAASHHMRQDALYVHVGGSSTHGTTVAAFWDGAVAAAFTFTRKELNVSELQTVIERYWRGLARIAQHYGGKGVAHVAVVFNETHESFTRISPEETPVTDIRRWTSVREPDAVETAGVAAELQRGFGATVWGNQQHASRDINGDSSS